VNQRTIKDGGNGIGYWIKYLPVEVPELTPFRDWVRRSIHFVLIGGTFCAGGLLATTSGHVQFAGVWWQNVVRLPTFAQRLLSAFLTAVIVWSLSYCVGLAAVTFLRPTYRDLVRWLQN
jgi:hypothetical protein